MLFVLARNGPVRHSFPKPKGVIAAKLKRQADGVDRRYQALTAREMELQEALTLQLTNRNMDNLLQFRETVAAGLNNPTPEDKQRFLEILQVTVTVTNGIAIVTCRLGGIPLQLRLTEFNKS